MIESKFSVYWSGDLAAGIRPGSQRVTIYFEDGETFDAETIEYLWQAIAEFYDGAAV